MACVALGLALSLYRELPELSALAGLTALLVVLWRFTAILVRAIERVIIAPTGIKWDLVLMPVFVLVALRYGASLVAQHDFSTFKNFSASMLRFLIFGLACAFTTMGGRMAREIRLKPAKEAGAEEGDQKAFDWHRDVERYQVPLVWFALGLTLFQMVS